MLLSGDHSLTHNPDAACGSADNCILTIPFTGSGITIFVYQAGPTGINASFAIDDSHTQTKALNAPPAPNYKIANVSMFNVQHGMMRDYAYVNETLVTTPAPETTTSATTTALSSSSSSSTSTATTASSSGSHSDTAIIGGVIGLMAIIGGIFPTEARWGRPASRRPIRSTRFPAPHVAAGPQL
ncbi:hypothetical protein J3A83DRAFT_4375760 [Scleroderma citrinum]